MTRKEALRAAEILAASPAAKWIGNRLIGGVLFQMCMRCGAEQNLELPPNITSAKDVPAGFDEKLFAWKRDFQIAHEGCVQSDDYVWPEQCTTCDEPYSRDPTFRASICSNSFHCCRDCTWLDGRRIQLCAFHEADEKPSA